MKVRIEPGFLRGEVEVPSSKSHLHRLLICAALSEERCLVQTNGLLSGDILATIDCLRALGAGIDVESGQISVRPNEGNGARQMHCRESGSTLRFMLPLAAALGRSILFTGEGRLMQRPIEPLLDTLRAHGCTAEHRKDAIAVSGQLCAGEYLLPGDVSSQFVTGLLLALPLLQGDSRIRLTTELASEPYVRMTLNTLANFQVRVTQLADGYLIPGGQTYKSPGSAKAEGDWSSAAFWLCAGALGSDIRVRGLDPASVHGDREITAILKRMGAELKTEEDGIQCLANGLRGTVQSLKQVPDLGPVLALTAAFAKGKTVLEDADRLRLKESDRLSAICDTLAALGIRIRCEGDRLIVTGGQPQGGELPAFSDHRMVLSAAVAATACARPCTIDCVEAADKSYPGFFDEFVRLGGNITWLP